MNEFLRDRIVRKLDSLSDERLYQVLDYVEFLESKYAERQSPQGNVFTKFAEGIEDQLRAGRVSASTIADTMNLMNRAMGVLGNVAAAGKSVASDIYAAAATVTGSTDAGGSTKPPASGSTGPASQADGSAAAGGASQTPPQSAQGGTSPTSTGERTP